MVIIAAIKMVEKSFFPFKLNPMTCDIVCGTIIHTQHKNIILFLSPSLSSTHTDIRTYTHSLSTNVFFLNFKSSFSIPFFVAVWTFKNRLRCKFQYTPLPSFPFPLSPPSFTPPPPARTCNPVHPPLLLILNWRFKFFWRKSNENFLPQQTEKMLTRISRCEKQLDGWNSFQRIKVVFAKNSDSSIFIGVRMCKITLRCPATLDNAP